MSFDLYPFRFKTIASDLLAREHAQDKSLFPWQSNPLAIFDLTNLRMDFLKVESSFFIL